MAKQTSADQLRDAHRMIEAQNQEIIELENKLAQCGMDLKVKEREASEARFKADKFRDWMAEKQDELVTDIYHELKEVEDACEAVVVRARKLIRIWNKPDKMYWFSRAEDEFEASYGKRKTKGD